MECIDVSFKVLTTYILNTYLLLIKFIIMKFPFKSCSILSLAGMLLITACGDNSSTSTTSSSDSSSSTKSTDMNSGATVDSAPGSMQHATARDSGSANTVGNTNPDQATIDFMVSSNTKEMAWLMAGMKQGTSKEIKDHSRMMLADHKKMGAQVSALIASKNLTAPPVDTMNVVNINDQKGKEWDKAWVDKMVKDHQELLDKLKQSETAVRDSSLKKLVVNSEPVVKSHLDMVKKMQDKMK
jgi:putative membrane protein